MAKPTISIIAAHDQSRGIGKDGQLPWNLPEDLKHFKKITTGHPIIMGRKTFDSIGRPLPGRTNIVITRENREIPEVIVVNSLTEAINEAGELDNEVFIIGGGQIYEQAIQQADKLYLTIIEKTFPADTYFPNYEQFNETLSETKHQGAEFDYRFLKLVKNK